MRDPPLPRGGGILPAFVARLRLESVMRLILVPLDGSLLAERALPAALDLAARHHARIELVSVHQSALPARGQLGAIAHEDHYDAVIRAGLSAYLDVTAAKIRANHATCDVAGILLEGPVAAAIAAYARSREADLVAITTRGRGGPARWILGSVADALVRTLTVPVLLVRAEEDPGESVVLPLRRVLVALDGSPESERAVEIAVRLLRNDQATFTLLHVAPPLHPLLRTLANAEEVARDTEEQTHRAKAYLQEAVARCAGLGAITAAFRMDLNPARGIIAFAAEHSTDLIVLSTHGRGPIGRALLGSVADKVVRTATVPVLLCHTPRSP